MKPIFWTVPFLLFLLTFNFSGHALAAEKEGAEDDKLEQKVIERTNIYGGKTVQYSDLKVGLETGIIFYDGDNKIVRLEEKFTSGHADLTGVVKLVSHYRFDRLIKLERHFAERYANIRLVQKSVDHFDQATGKLIKRENIGTQGYFGNSTVYFEKNEKRKQRIEWHYPKSVDGVEKTVILYDNKGLYEIRVTNHFSARAIFVRGLVKTITQYDRGRQTKKEWFFSTEFAKKNQGVLKKVQVFYSHSTYKPQFSPRYFDAQGKEVKLKKDLSLP